MPLSSEFIKLWRLWVRFSVSGLDLKKYLHNHPIYQIMYDLDQGRDSVHWICEKAMTGDFFYVPRRAAEELERLEKNLIELATCHIEEPEKNKLTSYIELTIKLLRALPLT